MTYIIVSVISFAAGAAMMLIYHKKVVAQIERTKEQVKEAVS